MKESEAKKYEKKIDQVIEICDFIAKKFEVEDQEKIFREIMDEVKDFYIRTKENKLWIKSGQMEQVKDENGKRGDLKVELIDKPRRRETMIKAVREYLEKEFSGYSTEVLKDYNHKGINVHNIIVCNKEGVSGNILIDENCSIQYTNCGSQFQEKIDQFFHPSWEE